MSVCTKSVINSSFTSLCFLGLYPCLTTYFILKTYLCLQNIYIINKVTIVKMIIAFTSKSSASYSQQENLSCFACIHEKHPCAILKGQKPIVISLTAIELQATWFLLLLVMECLWYSLGKNCKAKNWAVKFLNY